MCFPSSGTHRKLVISCRKLRSCSESFYRHEDIITSWSWIYLKTLFQESKLFTRWLFLQSVSLSNVVCTQWPHREGAQQAGKIPWCRASFLCIAHSCIRKPRRVRLLAPFCSRKRLLPVSQQRGLQTELQHKCRFPLNWTHLFAVLIVLRKRNDCLSKLSDVLVQQIDWQPCARVHSLVDDLFLSAFTFAFMYIILCIFVYLLLVCVCHMASHKPRQPEMT